jgi:CubicO group peptidase (beta-lactamase class C family)
MSGFVHFFLSFLWMFPATCFGQTLGHPRPVPNSSNPLATVLDKKIDTAVRKVMKKNRLVGIEIGILKNGSTTFYAYGETERGNGQLPTENSIFEIGSITKTFTATLLACAANEEKLSLDDAANKYLPDSIPPLEYQGTPITLLTMSNHTSGLPRMPSNLDVSSAANYDDKALYSFYRRFKLSRKPGTKFEYSNLAVATLGVILERIYGMSLDSLMVKMICTPLDLNDTRLSVPAADSSRTVQGYDQNGGLADPWTLRTLDGCGGLRSTAADMLKYAAANMGTAPPTLNKAILLTHKITGRQKDEAVGLAWGIDLSDGHERFEHSGGTDGFQSFLVVDSRVHMAVVVLSNKHTRDDDLPSDLGEDILGWVEKNRR